MAFVFRKRCKCISLTTVLIYILFSLYASYKLLNTRTSDFLSSLDETNKGVLLEENRPGINFQTIERGNDMINIGNEAKKKLNENLNENPVVEIWGKAAIGLYLWEHILGGSLNTESTSLTRNGQLQLSGIRFRFRTGPGIVQGYVPTDVQYLILVLNGRDPQKITFAKTWLDYLEHLPRLRYAALVLLGDEKCNNDWLLPYMAFRGGKITFAFLTYDSALVDNVYFYQWPLGVATYRNFPKFGPHQIRADSPRTYLCNFFGTVYPGSSRQTLVNLLIKNESFNCIIRLRQMWMPSETEETLITYLKALKDSSLTLSPIGLNSESYRIYEALSCGSIPVVQNVMSDGNCGGSQEQIPYRLLKAFEAPLIYLTNWEVELPPLLIKHKSLPIEEKVRLHRQILDWYHNFKILMKHHFVDIVKLHFLNITTR